MSIYRSLEVYTCTRLFLLIFFIQLSISAPICIRGNRKMHYTRVTIHIRVYIYIYVIFFYVYRLESRRDKKIRLMSVDSCSLLRVSHHSSHVPESDLTRWCIHVAIDVILAGEHASKRSVEQNVTESDTETLAPTLPVITSFQQSRRLYWNDQTLEKVISTCIFEYMRKRR